MRNLVDQIGAFFWNVFNRPQLKDWLDIMIVAFLIGKLTLRLSGHYLPLATIAWGLSLYFLFGTMAFLGGHTGLTGIPPISVFGYELRQGEEV